MHFELLVDPILQLGDVLGVPELGKRGPAHRLDSVEVVFDDLLLGIRHLKPAIFAEGDEVVGHVVLGVVGVLLHIWLEWVLVEVLLLLHVIML